MKKKIEQRKTANRRKWRKREKTWQLGFSKGIIEKGHSKNCQPISTEDKEEEGEDEKEEGKVEKEEAEKKKNGQKKGEKVLEGV